ncbi:porin family protein [Nibrella viscosa]|uniref:Porin family protein n=1 Tax=Nibrella viscosa TaxID=1084524 RepID=A0ABP8KEW7_9BACT
MKKIVIKLILAGLTTAGCMVFTSGSSQAQTATFTAVRAGIKGGFNASTLDLQNVNNRKEAYGFHAGVFAQIPAGDFFAIQPELLYTAKGASANYNVAFFQGRNTFRLNYLELPILATFKVGPSVELQAGPYGAYLLSANMNSEGTFGTGSQRLNTNDFNKFDLGLAGGVNIYFGKAFLGLRYGQGLNRITNTEGARLFLGDARNAVGMVSIGYSIR